MHKSGEKRRRKRIFLICPKKWCNFKVLLLPFPVLSNFYIYCLISGSDVRFASFPCKIIYNHYHPIVTKLPATKHDKLFEKNKPLSTDHHDFVLLVGCWWWPHKKLFFTKTKLEHEFHNFSMYFYTIHGLGVMKYSFAALVPINNLKNRDPCKTCFSSSYNVYIC